MHLIANILFSIALWAIPVSIFVVSHSEAGGSFWHKMRVDAKYIIVILLVLGSITGLYEFFDGENEYNKGYKEGYEEGYYTGETDGYDAGYETGYEDGHTAGGLDFSGDYYNEGYDDGYDAGFKEGSAGK